jgi:hypothetical protein
MKADVEYVARAIGTIEDGSNPLVARCDDFLEAPTLQFGVLGDNFAGATGTVFIITEKSISTAVGTDGQPNGLETRFAAGIAVPTVIQLPVCFGVIVEAVLGIGTTIRCRLGGNAYTTHPDGVVQGP